MNKPKIRIFINCKTIYKGFILTLSDNQSHYLKNVMRAKLGTIISVFNGLDGEWLSEIITEGKKQNIKICIFEQIQAQNNAPDISLIFGAPKNTALFNIIRQATEMNVKCIYPVVTDYTVNRNVNIEKLNLIAIEAAEQSERLDVPKIFPISALQCYISLLRDSTVIFCDESGGLDPYDLVTNLRLSERSKLAILIGPEGGFSEEERQILCSYKNSVRMTLGSTILKADTAVIVALSYAKQIIQSVS